MRLRVVFYLFAACIALWGCSPSSSEDFRQEGRGATRSIVKELKKIETRQQLVEAAPRLTRLFNDLVDVMIAARQYQDNHPLAPVLEIQEDDHRNSAILRLELNRIYKIEGGRDIVEGCQDEALHRLDAFEQRRAKRQSSGRGDSV